MPIDKCCLRCRKSFQVDPYRVKSARFCSVFCYHQYGFLDRSGVKLEEVQGACWIPLGGGRFCLVDEDRFNELSQYNWIQHPKGYAYRTVKISGRKRNLFLHHLILGSTPDGYVVDHKNRNRRDNRRENLRFATKAQSMQNKIVPRPQKASRYRGVFKTKGQLWRVQICAQRRVYRLGTFEAQESAAHAYDEAARELHGDFARLNFPKDGERSAAVG